MLTWLHGDFYDFWVDPISPIPYHDSNTWPFREAFELTLWRKYDFIEYRHVWVLIFLWKVCILISIGICQLIYSIDQFLFVIMKNSNSKLRVHLILWTYMSIHMQCHLYIIHFKHTNIHNFTTMNLTCYKFIIHISLHLRTHLAILQA